MKICIHRASKRIIEMQSDATEGTLIRNAVNGGYKAKDIEEREVDQAGYANALAEDPVENETRRTAETKEKTREAAKAKVSAIEAEVGKAKDIDSLKAVVLDLVKQVKVLTE